MFINDEGEQLCESCFAPIDKEPCKKCGYEAGQPTDRAVLIPGTVLDGRYRIGKAIGKGGFGITYLAYDLKLDFKVAVKEYYPYGLATRDIGTTKVIAASSDNKATFEEGASKFYEEAKLVAKFNGHPNIVSVTDYFRDNDTVYFTMGYIKGKTLKAYLRENKFLTAGQAVYVAGEVSNALIAAHEAKILHRDISPDNIMVCDNGGIRLLDFGAARQILIEGSQSLSVILKQGFAPLEQYQKKGKQGPWTDIYSLGATLYCCLTGDVLDDPMTRFDDDSEYSGTNHGIDEKLWQVIKKATMLKIDDRYQDVFQLRNALEQTGIAPEPIVTNTHTISSEAVEQKIDDDDSTVFIQPVAKNTEPISDKEISATLPARETAQVSMTMPADSERPIAVDTSKLMDSVTPGKKGKKKIGVIAAAVTAIAVIIDAGIAVPYIINGSEQNGGNAVDTGTEIAAAAVSTTTPKATTTTTPKVTTTVKTTTTTAATTEEIPEINKLYNFTEGNGGIVINNYNGSEENLIIPSEINGLPVVVLNDNAFARNTHIKSVEIPDTVKRIGGMAFNGCEKIQSISIPDSVEIIGDYAFNNCTGLKEIVLPNSVKVIGEYAFNNCVELQSVTISDKVTVIPVGLFYNCDKLKQITLPDSVKKIEANAFGACDALENVNVSASAKIDDNAAMYSPKAKFVYSGDNAVTTTAATTLAETTVPEETTVTTSAQTDELTGNTVTIGKKTYKVNMKGTLDLTGMNLTNSDIKVLSRFTKVTEIILSNNKITDLSCLSELTQLEKLTYHDNSVKSLKFAENLTKLVVLGAENNGITDLSPLSKHTKLEELWINGNKVKSLDPISKCKNLRCVSVSDSPILDINALKGKQKLETLHLANCNLTSIEPLRGCSSLKQVDLYNNFISDATPLNNSILDYLWIGNNNLKGDIDAIYGIRIRVELNISGNGYDLDTLYNYASRNMNADMDGFTFYY